MKKQFLFSLLAMAVSFASFALGPISGSTGACLGSMGYVSDSMYSGGTWSSSNPAVATIDATGAVYSVSAGVTTITYTLGTAFVTEGYTVSPTPSAISGPSSLCSGTTAAYSDATVGGVWSSTNTSVATISAATGVATGVASGTTDLEYTIGSGCSATFALTVSGSTLIDSITGPTTVCAGSTITLACITSGGTWVSANPSIATISATSGVLTGVSAGTATISYEVSSSCGTVTAGTTSISVIGSLSAGTISGPSTVTAGSTISLSDGIAGGTWSSSTTSVATVTTSGGVVTGVAAGSATITYTVSGCGTTAFTTAGVTVTAFDGIAGTVYFPSGSYYGSIKVWLITYDTATLDLEAYDSLTVSCAGASVPYLFSGVMTDSFRIKAAQVYDSTTTGYIPTYHTSSFYWHDATVLYHTSGTADMGQDINMAYGTVTAGPGFIAGNVTTGANRGTASDPAVNLQIDILNSTTGALLQHTFTDATGSYTFSNLPVGQSYTIYPEAINYATTAYTSISLTAAAPGMSAANFIQHTKSKTITPIMEGVNPLNNTATTIFAYPNPTSGNLNIQWTSVASEKASVVVTDVTGRQVYSTIIMMNQGTGLAQLDLSNLTSGLYIVNVKSSNLNYNNKIEIQH